MFWFGKKYKEQADKIVIALHEQIFDAMKVNEKLAGENMKSSPFLVGYVSHFVSAGFVVQGIPSKQSDKYLKYICNDIVSSRLWEVYTDQLAHMGAVQALLGRPSEDFEKGAAVGMWDGSNLIAWDESASRTNLKSYLLDQELDYLEPKV